MAISPIGSTERKSRMGLCGAFGCTAASGFCALLVAPTIASMFFCGISWWVSSYFCWGSCAATSVSCSMASVWGFRDSSSMGVDSTGISSGDVISSISTISGGFYSLSFGGPCDLV
jgi:hypothetical protein